MALKRHRDASPDSVFRPPASLVVKSFVGREGSRDVALNHEGIRDPDPIAIAIDIIGLKKPSDIHVALGDLKLVDREHHRPVDPKLVLLEAASKSSRNIREFVKAACRDRVIEIAGCDRKKLCRPNSDVSLR
jgi:hypothetical protein